MDKKYIYDLSYQSSFTEDFDHIVPSFTILHGNRADVLKHIGTKKKTYG